MLSEKEQKEILKLFKILMESYKSEIERVNVALIEWEDEQSITVTSSEVPHNDKLNDKIKQLEKRKAELEAFVTTLTPMLKLPDRTFTAMRVGVKNDLVDYTMTFNSVKAMPTSKDV